MVQVMFLFLKMATGKKQLTCHVPFEAPKLDFVFDFSAVTTQGSCFYFFLLMHGFFLALKLAGVRGPKTTSHTEHERGHSLNH